MIINKDDNTIDLNASIIQFNEDLIDITNKVNNKIKHIREVILLFILGIAGLLYDIQTNSTFFIIIQSFLLGIFFQLFLSDYSYIKETDKVLKLIYENKRKLLVLKIYNDMVK